MKYLDYQRVMNIIYNHNLIVLIPYPSFDYVMMLIDRGYNVKIKLNDDEVLKSFQAKDIMIVKPGYFERHYASCSFKATDYYNHQEDILLEARKNGFIYFSKDEKTKGYVAANFTDLKELLRKEAAKHLEIAKSYDESIKELMDIYDSIYYP